MSTIWYVEQLRPLEAISRRHGIAFKLRGGVAFRLVLALAQSNAPKPPLDLFSLTPSTSDVDLTHSGPPELTRILLDEILTEIPAGECFRWELRSADESNAVAALVGSNLVPARLLEVTDEVPNRLVDPARGLDDIIKGQYRYSRNSLFKQSERYRRGHDLEAFSALLYLQTLAEARISPSLIADQPGWHAVASVFTDGLTDPDLIPLLQQHAYLRSRLRHLLRATATAFPSRMTFLDAASKIGLLPWLWHLNGDGPTVPFDPALRSLLGLAAPLPEAALATSNRLTGDVYRLTVPPLPWTHTAPDNLTLPKLGMGESVLLVSPQLQVLPGIMTELTSLGETQVTSAVAQEFIHVQLPDTAPSTEPLRSMLSNTSDLSAFIMLKDPQEGWVPFALPAVVLERSSALPLLPHLTIRMNCLGLLAEAAVASIVPAYLVLVGLKAPAS